MSIKIEALIAIDIGQEFEAWGACGGSKPVMAGLDPAIHVFNALK